MVISGMSRSGSGVNLRVIRPVASDLAALQRVFEESPDYFIRVTGHPAVAEDAHEAFATLPPGCTADDKFVLAVEWGGEMVGCVDLVRGYPHPRTAFLGLLLVTEAHQGRGLGRAAVEGVQAMAREWGADRLRLAVIATNEPAFAFWRKLGFVETGERAPYRCDSVASEAVLFEKPLR